MSLWKLLGKLPGKLLAWLMLANLCLPCATALAADAHTRPLNVRPLNVRPLDVRLLIDVSNRMQEQDKADLRRAAVTALIAQLPLNTKAGLWGYAESTQRYLPYGDVTDMWRQVAMIHGQALNPRSGDVNLERALEQVLWDLDDPQRPTTHLVLFSNGAMDTANIATEEPSAATRTRLLALLSNRLAGRRVQIHGLSVADAQLADDVDFVGQLAAVSGGLHRVVATVEDAQQFAQDLVRWLDLQGEALVDAHGRFQIPQGTQSVTVMWPRQDEPVPQLETPDGKTLSRYASLEQGRWLLAEHFEIATLNQPATGWWRIAGVPAARVALISDLQIKVRGLDHTVIPTQESSAVVELYSHGQQVLDQTFLDLLDVRVWLNSAGERQALPVDAEAGHFRAYFVNIEDGAHELEVELVGPTFAQQAVRPFTARNPLTLEVRGEADGSHHAWVTFVHPELDARSIKISSKIRIPPQVGKIRPATRLPAGMWRVALDDSGGGDDRNSEIIELSLSLAGNYLSGEGFFLKTKPVALTLPLPPGQTERMRFDAEGHRIEALPDVEAEAVVIQSPTQTAVGIDLGDASIDSRGAGTLVASAPDSPASVSTMAQERAALPPQSGAFSLSWLWIGLLTLATLLCITALAWFLKPPSLAELPAK